MTVTAPRQAARGGSVGAMQPSSTVRRWNVAAGQFFFKFRDALFPFLILLVTLLTRPRILFGDARLDQWLTRLGPWVALAGEAVRLTTIGFEYIERGGKNRQVWASKLVQGGVYGLTRNPMYVGNTLIVVGLCVTAGAPAAYFFVIPLFLFIYQAIISAEEAFLREKFGAEYEAYCQRVPRWFPSFVDKNRAFSGMRYNWKRALRQDLSTLAGLLLGIILFPVWRALWLGGVGAFTVMAPRASVRVLAVVVLYATLHRLKKLGRLHDPT